MSTKRHHPAIWAVERPGDPAYIMGATGETVSWAQLDQRTNQCANLLRSVGVGVGGHVAILAENHARFLEVFWSTQRSGVYLTPLSTHLTLPEILYVLDDAGATVLFCSDRFVKMAKAIVAERDDVTIFMLDPVLPDLSDVEGAQATRVRGYEAERDAMSAEPVSDATYGWDMIYTSGTTGRQKGVRKPMLGTDIDVVPDVYAPYPQFGFGPGSTYLSGGPLYHASPLHTSIATLTFGGTVVVPASFDPEAILSLIETHGVTHTNWVPIHFSRFLQLPPEVRDRYDVSSLVVALHGAAPCPPAVKRAMIEWFGPVLMEYYGGTENIGGTIISSQEWLERPGSVGQTIGGAIHILDTATMEEVPVGATGVVYFETDFDVKYHNDPDKTAALFSPQGWATLGDVGHVDADGYLFLTGRSSDLIISGGVNIYPKEIEECLLGHPAVADVAVLGVPNEEFGEEVKAVIELVEGADASGIEAELMSFCRTSLAGFKCPRSVDVVETLPRRDNGKLYKRLLRDHYWQDAPPAEGASHDG